MTDESAAVYPTLPFCCVCERQAYDHAAGCPKMPDRGLKWGYVTADPVTIEVAMRPDLLIPMQEAAVCAWRESVAAAGHTPIDEQYAHPRSKLLQLDEDFIRNTKTLVVEGFVR